METTINVHQLTADRVRLTVDVKVNGLGSLVLHTEATVYTTGDALLLARTLVEAFDLTVRG